METGGAAISGIGNRASGAVSKINGIRFE